MSLRSWFGFDRSRAHAPCGAGSPAARARWCALSGATSARQPLRSLRAAIAMLLLPLLASCVSVPAPIRIGISAFPSYELLYLAQEVGLFRAEGVEVQVVEFGGLADQAVALRRGLVDGAATTLADFVLAVDREDIRARVAWVLDVSEGADVIVARAPVSGVRGLQGRRVGLEVDSLGSVVLGRALERAGLSLSDVTVVPLTQEAGERALIDGVVDAFVTYPPTSIRLLRRIDMRNVFDSRALPGEILDVLVLSDELLSRRPDDVRRLLRAYVRAQALLASRPDEALAIMARREHLAPAEFAAGLSDGLRVLQLADQAAYLGAGGSLTGHIATEVRLLQQLGRLGASTRSPQGLVADWSRIDPSGGPR